MSGTVLGRELPPPGVTDKWLSCLIGMARNLPGYAASPREIAALRHAIDTERTRRARLRHAGRVPAHLPRCPVNSIPTPEEIIGELLADAWLVSLVGSMWQAAEDAARRAALPPEPVRPIIRRSTYRRRRT